MAPKVAAALLLVALPGCRGDEPSRAACAALWNRPANEALHAVVTNGDLDEASVRGEEGNPGRWGPGCSVVLRTNERGPWMMCFAEVDDLARDPSRWDCVRGRRWGGDSPEPEPPFDGRVRPDGTVSPG